MGLTCSEPLGHATHCRLSPDNGTMTHDYKRIGTTTLFAAFNLLDETVIERCMRRHATSE